MVKKLKKLKVDHVGEFVDAGHEGVDDDEGRVEEEKRTNHNILGRVDKEYKLPISEMKGEIMLETVVTTSVLISHVAEDKESFHMERPRGFCKEEERVREANNNQCILGPEY